jgi:hypothetical protein
MICFGGCYYIIYFYTYLLLLYHSITSYYCLMKYIFVIFVVRRTETRRVKYIYEYAHIIYMDIHIFIISDDSNPVSVRTTCMMMPSV